MSKIMKMIRYFSIAALASLLAHSVWAADLSTADVVWERDFGVTKKIGKSNTVYTFNANGNTVQADGTLKIASDAPGGGLINSSDGSTQAWTILVKYKNLSAVSGHRAALLTMQNGTNIHDMGLASSAAGATDLKAYWNGSANNWNLNNQNGASLPAEGFVQFGYNGGANFWTGFAETIPTNNGGGIASGFSFSNVTSAKGFAIGGPRQAASASTCGYGVWDDLVIEAVAIFRGSWLAANANGSGNTVFPSVGATLIATVDGDASIDALSWVNKSGETAAYDKTAKIALYGSGKISTTADTMPTGTVFVGFGIELVYPTNTTATHSGSGTVTFSGLVPNNSAHNYFGMSNGAWTGTVKISNKDNGSNPVPNLVYSNSNSTLWLNGTSGYLGGIWNGGTFNGTICLKDYGETPAWNQNNGGSSSFQKIGALTGSGTWKATGAATQSTGILDGSQFTGGFDFNLDTGIKFGSNPTYVADDRGYIVVNEDATVQIAKTWKPTRGLKLNGTIIAKGGTLGANTTFGSSATIDVSEGTLTLASGKSVSFGTALNLVGVENGKAIIEGVTSAPSGLNLVAVSVNGALTENQIVYDADSQAVVYKTAALSVWTPNTAALENGLLVWNKENAWLDGTTAKSWSTASAEQDVKIDAASVSGVVISGAITAHDIYVINSSDLPKDFDFHNSTKGVDGTHEVDATIDCLTANAVIMTGYHGKLGLKVPVKGEIGLGDSANLTFKTGTAEGAASTAYAYQFSHIGTIAVEGEGKFKVPVGMYGVSFAPEASATILYDAEGTVTGAISGAGKVAVNSATVTFNTMIDCTCGLAIESGKAIFPNSIGGESIRHNVTIANGSEMQVDHQDGFSYSHNYTIDVYGTLKLTKRQSIRNAALKLHNGAVIDGTSTDSQGDFEYISSNTITLDDGASATIRRLGIRTGNTITINGNNATLTLDKGVYSNNNNPDNGKLSVSEGVTVVITGAQDTNYTGSQTLTKLGNGVLKIADGAVIKTHLVVNAGTLDLSELTGSAAGVITRNLTIGENATVIFPATNEFTACGGTLAGITESLKADGNGGLIKVSVNGSTITTESIAAPTDFGKTAGYWSNIYVGPAAGIDADAAELNQWIAPAGNSLAPLVPSSERWQGALFDGDLMNDNVSIADGYKSVTASQWEGWALKVGLVNHAMVTVNDLVKFQGGEKFIGVDATSKLVIGSLSDGRNSTTATFDIAAPEGVTVNGAMPANSGENSCAFSYIFRGEGSMKVDGAFGIGSSHSIKHVDITLSAIEGTKFKDIISKKLIGFASHGDDMSVKWADDATISTGCTISTTPVTPLAAIGTASIALKDDGVYVEYVDYVADHPPTYRWEHIGSSSWGAESAWKGLLDLSEPPTARTWDEANAKTETIVDDIVDGKFYINMAKPFYFYFDTAKSSSVVVDKTVHASQTGYNPETGANGTGNRYVIVSGTGEFSFNLPQIEGVDEQGAPKSTFDFSTYDVEMAAPVDATTFNGQLGLRAKLTGPITLGPQTKIVFIAPAGEETIAYDYNIVGCEGSVEVRGPGTFIVPNTMTNVPFEKTEGGFLKYDITSGTVTAAAISGNGGVIKTGAGTLKITEAASFKGALQIEEGAVEVIAPPQDSEHAAIQVTVSDGAEMRLVLSDLYNDYTAAGITGKVVFVDEDGNVLESSGNTYIGQDTPCICSVGETQYHNLENAIESAKTAEGHTVTMLAAYDQAVKIPEGVAIDTNGKDFTGTVTGAGKIVFNAFPNTATNLKTSLQQEAWTGTLVIRGASLAGTTVGANYCCTFNEYGHIGSKIELDNCSGYFGVYTDAVPRVIPEVVITGTFTRTTVGYSKFRTVFRKISGSGTFAGSTGGSNQTIYFEDVSDFTGTITTSNDNIVIGPAGEGLDERGHLHIAEGTVFAVPSTGTWSATAIDIDGTLDFRATSRETAFFAGDTTIGETASIRFPADCAENATLSICTGSLTASDSETAVPIMVGDYAFKAKLRYDIPTKSVSYRCDSSVTPVALWKGDFKTATKGGITLNANDNTIADDDAGSVVTIASTGTKGVTFNVTDNDSANMGQNGTVLVKYSSLSTPASNAMLFSFRTNGYDNDILGMYLNNSGTLATLFNDNTHNGGNGNGKPAASGMFAETIAFTAGAPDREGPSTFIKDLTSADFEVGREARGVYVSSQTITGFAIGGPRSSGNFTKLAGMKIEAVAVFNKVLTTDEMNSYDWGFDGEDPTMTWNGADGADIAELSNWTSDSSEPSFEDFDLLFPSTVDEEVKGLTVSEGFTNPVAAKIEGAYKLTSGTLNMNSLSFGANGSLRIEKGAKINLEGFSKALLSKITFAGGSLTVKEAQRFTSSDVLNIADISDWEAGAYELISWTGHPNSGTTGYGRPATPVITGVKTDWEAKLVYQTHGIVLLLRDPEWLARPALTIWPFGDSITEGMNQNQTHANYRIQLYQKLQLLGYNVKSVGFSTRTYNQRGAYDPSGYDLCNEEDWIRHSGVGGELAVHYTSNHGTLHDSWANALDQAGDPDIVLIHIGINDITGGASNGSDNGARWQETYGSVTNIAANILRERPNTKVVLSSMNRLEKGQTYQGNGNANYVKPFRDEMVALMTKVAAGEIAEFPAGRVLFADMYDAIRPRSFDNFQDGENEEDGLFESDHIHPNWEGHHRMSDCWLEQVRAAFPDPEDKAEVFHSRRGTPAEVPATELGAVKNVPAEYMTGFTKATVITPAENGMERANTVSVNNILDGNTEITKVGYYVEYVFPSATTNIHRWVWVDMDAVKDGMTVAEAGLPTKTIQQVVNKLHVASNHLAIHPVAATDDSVKGFIEFSPESFGGNGGVAGGPAHWMNNTSWNDAFNGGAYGSMQMHRMAPGANPYDPGSTPPAEVLFAYNAWNCGNDGKATEFGIGDFNQHLTGFTTDWVNMRNTETMHSGCLKAKSIEIWVKVVGQPEEPVVDDNGITPSIIGATTIEITVATGAGEDQSVSGTTIPLETGVYTVKGKKGDTVVGEQEIGVIAAKDAETTTAPVTTAVAVPFKGKTVATLLNTALLNKDDTLMAWIDGKYEVWTLTADKTWAQQPITRAGGTSSEGIDPTTAALKCGQAVWVTTAGKIVTFGDTAAEGDPVEIGKGHNLLGSIAYTDAEPAAIETDQVQLIGEVDTEGNEVISRYNKTATGWESKIQKRSQLGNGKWVVTEETSYEAPTVKPGRGYWLIRK